MRRKETKGRQGAAASMTRDKKKRHDSLDSDIGLDRQDNVNLPPTVNFSASNGSGTTRGKGTKRGQGAAASTCDKKKRHDSSDSDLGLDRQDGMK